MWRDSLGHVPTASEVVGFAGSVDDAFADAMVFLR